MNSTSEFRVRLSSEMWRQFCRQSSELDVPIDWLVAALVCDTIESLADVDETFDVTNHLAQRKTRHAGRSAHGLHQGLSGVQLGVQQPLSQQRLSASLP
jgi:hypothetical protein